MTMIAGVASRCWAAYRGLLARRPYTTNSLTGGSVMLAGDGLAQWYERYRSRMQHQQQPSHDVSSGATAESHDWVRAGVMAGFSMGAFMPVNTFWYGTFLERVFPNATCQGRSPRILSRVLAKSVLGVCSGLFLNPCFFVWATTAEAVLHSRPDGEQFSWGAVRVALRARFENDIVDVLRNSYSLWVPVNMLNFVVTPLPYRVLVIGFTSTFWNAYLSLMQHEVSMEVEDADGIGCATAEL